MSTEQRARAMKRAARNSFYHDKRNYGYMAKRGITNWRMIIARRLGIPISEVRRILENNDE